MTPQTSGDHVELMRRSLLRFVSRDLLDGLDTSDPAAVVLHVPYALASHGTEPDPILNYGNEIALRWFERDCASFTSLPSRVSPAPMERTERDALLARIARDGLVDDYHGVRISATGRRLELHDALVRNLVDADGTYRGLAALFQKVVALHE